MTSIPTNLARVPMTLSSQVLLSNLNRTQTNLLNVQVQMATGKRINRPSDDIVSASVINAIENEMDRRQHRMKALDHADAILANVDQSLGEMSDLLLQAKSIASQMVNSTYDEQTRKNNALVIDSIIDEMERLANRKYQGIHFFGGERSASEALREHLGGFEFLGTTGELNIDVGRTDNLPITVSADRAFGSISARVEGNVDLDPALTGETRLRDLNGAAGEGITKGSIKIDLNGVEEITVDLESADSIEDVADLIEDAIRRYESDSGATLLGPGGVSVNGTTDSLSVDVAGGATLTFRDSLTGRTATDLGLSQSPFTNADPNGEDLDPRVTPLTKLSDLGAVTALGTLKISNGGQTRALDLSGAETVQDLMNIIESGDIGVRFEIDDSGRSINVLNDLAGGAMSIFSETGGETADQLGIRSFREDTPLSQFNRGRGVQILSGNVDPVNGDPDPMLDRDFQVTLSDGSSFDVDLAGAKTVGDVIDIITDAAPPTFSIAIDEESGGFVLSDNSGGGGSFSVEPLNGSFAAADLGIRFTTDSATFTGEDRAKVEIDGVMSHLIALRDALDNNDIPGITFAGGRLEQDVDRVAQTRAVVGQRMERVTGMRQREEDEDVLDASLRSQAEDLDFAEASVRFSQYQTFLQASLAAGAQSRRLSLLDFLG